MSMKQELINIGDNSQLEVIAENMGVSVAEAKQKIRNMSFSEYQKIVEANADNNPWLTTGTQGSANNIDAEPDISNIDTANMSDDELSDLYQALEIWDSENTDSNTMRQEIEKKLQDPSLQDKMSDHLSDFKSGFTESEISRLQELAGIAESATSGGVSAGNIAGAPSVVGDTSDSHKPTNKLITRMKRKREDRKREKEKEAKKRKQEGRNW